MALASRLRRVFTVPSTLSSRFAAIRLNSTLTSPKLFISAKIVRDRATGRSKGFGFVTYTSIEEAEKAREEMNAKFLHGWVIFVDPAKPREFKPTPRSESGPSETGFRTNKTVGWCG
ncbi:hypothetical protein ES319_D04G137800v1 [Gossypium barbadense]|uniref:RRM domain-containing protein n=3 Tax=Gossypium TaxID=3633 RepID=A0A7J9K7E2_9ROSI|nr:hypothetical protein ES319_D04G137800v1 [Gossypium barbadense]MBA0697836.1 hypothetical protein [Gossypium aridum]MBA0842368.1 hypothetical protein [Gossypium armourianum]